MLAHTDWTLDYTTVVHYQQLFCGLFQLSTYTTPSDETNVLAAHAYGQCQTVSVRTQGKMSVHRYLEGPVERELAPLPIFWYK